MLQNRQSLYWVLILLGWLILVPGRSSASTYATWIMVWNGHTESWWKPTDSQGARALVGGKWQAIDWADNNQINEYLENIKSAGIQVVIADLTNGWGWLNTRCQFIQGLCAKKGLRFCVAENSGGDTAKFETHAQDIWNSFAGPGSPHPGTYLIYHGKPMIVCYGIRSWVEAYRRSTGPARTRFSLVWSSGEDSEKDKWGWQLEPWIGSIPSADSMFVTSSIKWSNADEMWRKSLAWLDYNFALARRQHPEFVIVGSYDDVFERNSWLVADTTGCAPGRQMRDATGAVSATAYYNRVKQWITGKPEEVRGGLVRDGAYRIINRKNGKALSIQNTDTRTHQGTVGAPGAKLVLSTPGSSRDDPLQGIFWLYHLGHDEYRIIALQSGLSLEMPGQGSVGSPTIVQGWDSPEPGQRWRLKRARAGWYRIQNDATGILLDLETGAPMPASAPFPTVPPGEMGPGQQWEFQPVIMLSGRH